MKKCSMACGKSVFFPFQTYCVWCRLLLWWPRPIGVWGMRVQRVGRNYGSVIFLAMFLLIGLEVVWGERAYKWYTREPSVFDSKEARECLELVLADNPYAGEPTMEKHKREVARCLMKRGR